MRFAENNRISHRQLYRQMILAFLAPFLLCLPGEEGLLGKSGIVGICLALAVLALYALLLLRMAPWYSDLVKSLGAVSGRGAGAFFLVYVILTGAYLARLMADLIPAVLVTGIPGSVISLLAVAVCSFGTCRGMQRRGRMAEASGGILLWGIVLMMVLCLGQGRMDYLKEMAENSTVQGKTVIDGCYRFLCASSGLGLLPFSLKDVERRGKAGKTLIFGIVTLGGILIGTLLLLPAVLGWERLKEETWPVIPLMAGADLPGNVLARFDVLWMGFLLYSLLFAVGSIFHYGHQIALRAHMGTGRWWLPAAVFLMSVTEFGGKQIRDYYGFYLSFIFVPGLVILQIYMAFRGNMKRRRRTAAALLLVALLGLTGCAAIEPEKRMYPLALGVDVSEQGFSMTYGMPDLPQATGQEKPEENGSIPVLSISGKDFREIGEIYDRSQEKYLDISHIQVILLGNRLIESGRWDDLFSYLKEEPFMGENVYLFRTENPEAVLSWDSKGSSVGAYLTGLLENRLPGQQKSGVTLRQAYHQWYQDGTLVSLPLIVLEEEGIQVYLEEKE